MGAPIKSVKCHVL